MKKLGVQIYKIYINEKSLILIHSDELENQSFPSETSLVLRYAGRQKMLFQCIDTLEKKSPYKRVILHSSNYDQLKLDLKSRFVIIKAGGGLVMNEHDEGLFIFRRGFWDLPKGKLDKGESYKAAAKREVEEETSVQNLKRGKKLLRTRHVFKLKSGQRVLKLTNWYRMTAPKQALIPEAKEQIEQAVWLKPSDFLKNYKPTFRSVVDVIKTSENQ